MAVNPLALGGGVLVVAAAIGGGVYASGALSSSNTPSPGQTEKQEPSWHSLFEDNDYQTKSASAGTDYHEKYGAKFNKYFVGVTTKAKEGNKPETSNDEWWKWSYDNNYTPNKKANDQSGFKDVSDETTLKTACTNAYKGTLNETQITQGSTNFQEVDVWKFCSPLGKKPVAIKDTDGYTTENIGGASEKTQLASAKDNDKFWEIKQKFFFAGTQPQATEAFFKKLYDDERSNPKPLSLKAKCGVAYSKNSTDPSSETAPKKDEVLKYCSLEESTTTAQV